MFETMSTFEEAVLHIKANFGKRRISTFAKKNSVSSDAVEVVDDIPIAELERSFKKNNGITKRLFKNLTNEQQQAWVMYYDDHKQLSLRVKAGSEPVVEHAEAVKPKQKPTDVSNETKAPKSLVELAPKKRSRKNMTDTEIVSEILQNAVNIDEVNDVPSPKPKRTRKPKA